MVPRKLVVCWVGISVGTQISGVCSADCTDKNYGVNCKETCGHCKVQSTCAITDGRCPNGCETWYISGICKTYLGMCHMVAYCYYICVYEYWMQLTKNTKKL